MSSLVLPDPMPPPGSPPQKSAPITEYNPYHLQHKRDEVQDFANINDKPFKNTEHFLSSLDFPLDQLPHRVTSLSNENLIDVANEIARAVKKCFKTPDLLVFKDSGNTTPRGHVTDTICGPDIVAAFDRDWKRDIAWPFVRLIGEKASGGNAKQQAEHTNSYLYYLLLTRPDLHAAQGLFTSESRITFILAMGGVGVQTLSAAWDDKDLYGLLYTFIYRLYYPAHFADPMYIKSDKASGAYTLHIAPLQKDIPGFNHIYGKDPFSTRTHVLSNPTSQVSIVAVIKDQLCEVGRRFNELEVLQRVHEPVSVPGVVEAVYSADVTTPESVKDEGMCKRRLGLSESGSPFTSIPTPRRMLQTLFDLLEVLRYLYSERRVLHRDISAGNVLYVEHSSCRTPLHRQSVPAQQTAANELPLCFAKFLLEDSKNPLETSLLLVDFDLAEHLDSSTDFERMGRTGTPIFMARAVEQNGPVIPPFFHIPVVPESPGCYTSFHQERNKRFEKCDQVEINPKNLQTGDNQSRGEWRHGLEHDAESVFWLLVYWAVMVQPKEKKPREEYKEEYIDPIVWPSLIGKSTRRDDFIRSLSAGRWLTDLTHSDYEPLATLISQLSSFLVVDRHWLSESDCRKRPEYLNEAFQRLILQFIMDNDHASFMDRTIDTTLRSTARSLKRDAAERYSEAKRRRVDTGRL